MGATKIEWAETTWNPVTGCAKISPGCKNCYAERMAKRLAGRAGYPKKYPFRVTLHRTRLEEPFGWKKPRMVFVCSMADLFHDDAIAGDFTSLVFEAMTDSQAEHHTFQVLTKRPDAAVQWLEDHPEFSTGDPLPNVWWGVTVEGMGQAWRIVELLRIPAVVRFVSLEPLLGAIDLAAAIQSVWPTYGSMIGPGNVYRNEDDFDHRRHEPLIHWVIVGAETGPGRRWCDNRWIEAIVKQGLDAGVPVFVKKVHKKGTGRLPVIVDDINEISDMLGYPPEQLRQWPARRNP